MDLFILLNAHLHFTMRQVYSFGGTVQFFNHSKFLLNVTAAAIITPQRKD